MCPCSSTLTLSGLSALNCKASTSFSVICNSCPWIFWISGLFNIVVIKHNFIFSSDISFDIINTFFLFIKAVYAAKLIANLLFPAFDGIAYAIVSPFLTPLKTCVKIGNGNFNPLAKLFEPSSIKLVRFLFNIVCLNFSVTVTWFIADSTSSTDISSYNS